MKATLLTGATGKLGHAIKSKWTGSLLLTPSHEELELSQEESLESYFSDHQEIDSVIHCAALARLVKCQEDPSAAILNNTIATGQLVRSILKHEKVLNRCVRFMHVSTDGVYAGVEGNYSELSATIPSNFYGWSKLGAECSVQMLRNHCIIRGRFFDGKNIPFNDSANDIYTSRMELEPFVKNIIEIFKSDFCGVLNVGEEKISDFDCLKKVKPDLLPCSRDDIVKNLGFEIAKDASMNCDIFKALK